MSLVKFDEPRVGIITNVNKFSSKFRKQVTNRQTILIDTKLYNYNREVCRIKFVNLSIR